MVNAATFFVSKPCLDPNKFQRNCLSESESALQSQKTSFINSLKTSMAARKGQPLDYWETNTAEKAVISF